MEIEVEKGQALSLPERERLSLARRLLESVESEVELAWEEEIVKRIAQIDAGAAVGRPWEEIKKISTPSLGYEERSSKRLRWNFGLRPTKCGRMTLPGR